ncbi:hypothetical protein KIN20_029090 [Parelaphostrongylus tenuis]|uniref:Uncharacterized protein n=1 Tax=Parelaphostrongylus tenuis TaxID=148309 RepID=A0AAD5R1V1_PARTN|nr:hypothetical protein KIN20_029090 [Parelaphostrongylus tenuis]
MTQYIRVLFRYGDAIAVRVISSRLLSTWISQRKAHKKRHDEAAGAYTKEAEEADREATDHFVNRVAARGEEDHDCALAEKSSDPGSDALFHRATLGANLWKSDQLRTGTVYQRHAHTNTSTNKHLLILLAQTQK